MRMVHPIHFWVSAFFWFGSELEMVQFSISKIDFIGRLLMARFAENIETDIRPTIILINDGGFQSFQINHMFPNPNFTMLVA